jgi:uncharacterized protein (TIGR01777 family)
MRIGVTGASGFIGHSLVVALLERGDSVTRFVRPSTQQDGVARAIVRWEPERGLVDESDLQRAGGFDAVIHLAGAGVGDKRWSPSRKEEILNSRVKSTSLLVSALAQLNSGVGLLASASAIGWYGSRGDDVMDETSSRGDGYLADVCERNEAATRSVELFDAPVALLRTGVVLSRTGGALKKQLPLFQWGLGGHFASGHQWISPISLFDQVQAILWIVDHSIAGPVNLTAPNPVTNDEFAHALAQQLHRPAVLSVPAFALKAALGAEMASELILASQRVVPTVLTDSGFNFRHGDIAAELKWSLTSNR